MQLPHFGAGAVGIDQVELPFGVAADLGYDLLAPRIHHKVVSTPLTHYSLTRFIAQVLGVKPLQKGATAPDLKAAFGL